MGIGSIGLGSIGARSIGPSSIAIVPLEVGLILSTLALAVLVLV